MTEKNADEIGIKIIDARQTVVRVSLAFAIVAALIFGWFAIRWQLGDMLADLTSPSDPNVKSISDLAVSFAPNDPTTRWLVASSQKNVFTTEAIEQTAKSFETVVQKSPNDYRWWVELGRAREQAEKPDLAEQAYRRALELAPNYTYAHWQTGNFFLRQNRSEEAFAELKKTAEFYSVYRDQVFSIAWDFYDKDTARLEEIAGNDPSVKASLARFYASKRQPEDSLRIWNTLPEADQKANEAIAKVIAQAFFEKKFFRQSLEFVRGLGIAPGLRGETVQNASFEQPIAENEGNYFGWKVLPLEKMEVKLDPTQKHEGSRSLRVAFGGYAAPQLFHVYQFVTVESGAKYQLTFWMKSDKLKSGGTPAFEIYNANDDKNIITSDPFPTGTNDWQPIKLEFTAPPNAEAIGIRLTRASCGTQCPIFGTIWLDDFKLERQK